MYVDGIKQTIGTEAIGSILHFAYKCGGWDPGDRHMVLKMESPAGEVTVDLPETDVWVEHQEPWPESLTGQPITIGFHCYPAQSFEVDDVYFMEGGPVKSFLHGPWNQSQDPLNSEFIKIHGQVSDINKPVKIEKKEEDTWITVGTGTTDSGGVFEIPSAIEGYFLIDKTPGKEDKYKLYIDGNLIDERLITYWAFDKYFSDPGGDIPMYSTNWNYLPSNLLIKIGRAEEISSQKINRVIVYGQTDEGVLLEQTEESDEVISGEEKAIELVFENKDLNTQPKVDEAASYLFGVYNSTLLKYEAEFKLRTDLQLLQKIKFMGYENIPELEMRIIDITYQKKVADTRVKIRFVPDQPLSELRDESYVTDQINDIIDDRIDEIEEIEIGTVTSVSGSEATVDLERGGSVKARILNPD